MIKAEDVPDEIKTAMRDAVMGNRDVTFADMFVAALNAWPGIEKSRDEDHPCLILPLERKE